MASILFVSDVSIQQVIGGAERVLFEQSTRLAQRGHRVHILTRRIPAHSHDSDGIRGVYEWRYPVSHSHPLTFLITTIIRARSLFERLNKRYAFDCINFHQPFTSFAIATSPLSSSIRKIYTCHSLSHEEFRSRHNKPESKWKQPGYFLNIYCRKYIERISLMHSDSIIVLSHYTADKLRVEHRIKPQHMTLIPGGVDVVKFHPAADKPLLKYRCGIEPQKMVILTVRNLVPRMGLENLIIAMKHIIQQTSEIYLLIGGSGPLENDLKKQAASCGVSNFIRFCGFIREDELPDYYRVADAFVLPTKELEGFGLVTLEALASGVPVLGTPVGGTREILERLDPEMLFRDIDPDSIAKRILEFYRYVWKTAGTYQILSKKCRYFAETHYSWDRNIDELEKIMNF